MHTAVPFVKYIIWIYAEKEDRKYTHKVLAIGSQDDFSFLFILRCIFYYEQLLHLQRKTYVFY